MEKTTGVRAIYAPGAGLYFHSRCEARAAPWPSAASFAHATLIGISVLPAVDAETYEQTAATVREFKLEQD